MLEAALVIPCYNEAARFDVALAARLLERPGLSLTLVDDGSTDGTARLLEDFRAAHPERVSVCVQSTNKGKAEAVRRGLMAALAGPARVVGFLDADFSVGPNEMHRLLDAFAEMQADVLLASRIRMLGADIQRRPMRHYLGRLFATAASLVLELPVYDTQCGAKLFRVSEPLRDALSEPFHSRWAFDVELIGRIAGPAHRARLKLVEVPLRRWEERAGSRLSIASGAQAFAELAMIRRHLSQYHRRRRGHAR